VAAPVEPASPSLARTRGRDRLDEALKDIVRIGGSAVVALVVLC